MRSSTSWLVSVLLISLAPSGLAQQDAGRDGGHDPGDGGAATPDAGDAGLPVLAAFNDGSFDLVDADATDRAVNEAVDAAIRTLHPSMRDAFRSQLRSTLKMPRAIVVVRESGRARVTWDAAALEGALDGTESAQRGPEGRQVRTSFRDENGGLVFVQRTSGFVRTDRIGGDGHGLLVRVTLRSGLLPRPLEIEARYARRTP